MNKGFLESHSIYSLGEECGFNSHQSFFRAKKDRTTHLTTHQKNKTPKTLSSRGVIVESEGTQTMKNRYSPKLFNLYTNPFKYNG